MKKIYERPVMVCENFKVDEYCSTCGKVEKEYYFDCNEDPGFIGFVYKESNGQDGLQFGDTLFATSFDDCAEHHPLTESELSGLMNGYVVKHQVGSGELLSAVPVLIWTGKNGNNCHCTTNVNVNTWETNLS